MALQLTPPDNAREELDKMGEIEFRTLLAEVEGWIQNGDWEDLAIARAIQDRGHSEDFAWWLTKEAQMRDLDRHSA